MPSETCSRATRKAGAIVIVVIIGVHRGFVSRPVPGLEAAAWSGPSGADNRTGAWLTIQASTSNPCQKGCPERTPRFSFTTGSKRTVDTRVAEADERRVAAARNPAQSPPGHRGRCCVSCWSAHHLLATARRRSRLPASKPSPIWARRISPTDPAPDYNSDPRRADPTLPRQQPAASTARRHPTSSVHDLEHGVIVIYYNPETTASDSATIWRTMPAMRRHVILALGKDGKSDHPTAWTHLLRVDGLDQEAMDVFLRRIRPSLAPRPGCCARSRSTSRRSDSRPRYGGQERWCVSVPGSTSRRRKVSTVTLVVPGSPDCSG